MGAVEHSGGAACSSFLVLISVCGPVSELISEISTVLLPTAVRIVVPLFGVVVVHWHRSECSVGKLCSKAI